jgi:type IV pilus assembly protein PilM
VDEQSIWKKEISFRRKPKEKNAQAAPGEQSTSMWKKEISLRKKPKPDPAETAAPKEDALQKESIWKKEISFGRKAKQEVAAAEPVDATPVPEPVMAESEVAADSSEHVQVSDTKPGPEETMWKKEVSFSRAAAEKQKTEPVTEDVERAEPVAAASDSAVDSSEHVQVSGTKPGPEETMWKKEVSFSRAAAEKEKTEPVTEDVETAEPVAVASDSALDSSEHVQVSDTETGPEESVWKREVSFSRKPKNDEPLAEEPAAEEPVLAQPVVEEPVAEEPVAKELVAEEPVAEEPLAEEPVAAEPVAEEPAAEKPIATETWSAKPSLPPQPVPEAATVVHPPVPAAQLPPLPTEREKVPFWKKEISLGGKKRDKAPKREKAPKAERGPETKEPKQPKERRTKAPRGGGKGSRRLVGLKIGASQLAAARVANNGSAELLQVARQPLDPGIVVGGELRDPEALAEALKDFFGKHKLPKRGVRLGIANNRIGVRTFEIAGIQDQKQLANAVRFRAQEALPIPIDEAVLDYQVLGEGVDEEGQPTRRILLVVAYRELIDRYVDACRKAGIALVGIDLEAFALLRALQAPQAGVGEDAGAALVAVSVGHERSTFAVSDGRVCEFTRVLEWGGSALNVAIARALDAAPSEVEQVKRALTLTDSTVVPEGLTAEQTTRAVDAVRKAIQSFARELVSSLQYYQNQPGSLGIGEIVLTGGTAHLPGLADDLERLIGVRVRVGDPLARMKVSRKIGQPEQVGSLAVAIGLGIED